ncbi:MAG: cytochrome P460 family protein [Acidobacteriota bacterium]
MRPTSLLAPAIVVAGLAIGSISAAPAGDGLKIPAGFDHWYLVNSMVITKDSPLSGAIGGLHHIHINSVGFARLKAGGSAPYPDGTIFVDDVRDFSLVDGSYVQGGRKAIPVMVKDSKRYASTGGWGFQAWAGGDPGKPLVTDSATACFACHTPQKANDYTFSTYLQ